MTTIKSPSKHKAIEKVAAVITMAKVCVRVTVPVLSASKEGGG